MSVVPLRGREGVAGVLTLERLGTENRFNEEEFELVKLFAAQVSIALHNAEIHTAVEIRARTDDLTGLLNHGTFEEWLARSVSDGSPFSLIMLDLDDFRTINNELGHQAGDRLLRTIADALRRAGRDSDHVFRYGGDEFAFLLPGTVGAGALRGPRRARAAVLVEDDGNADTPLRQVRRGSGVAGIVVGASAIGKLGELRERITSIPARGKRREEHAEALVPAQAQGHDHGDDDDDD